MHDIDRWLTPHPLVKGFPTADDRALGEHVRHMRNVHDVRLVGRVLDTLRKALGDVCEWAGGDDLSPIADAVESASDEQAEWCEQFGIECDTLNQRLFRQGLSVEEALARPIKEKRSARQAAKKKVAA